MLCEMECRRKNSSCSNRYHSTAVCKTSVILKTYEIIMENASAFFDACVAYLPPTLLDALLLSQLIIVIFGIV